MKKSMKNSKVDIDVPDDGIPGTLTSSVLSAFKSDEDALISYCKELKQLAKKYRLSPENLTTKAKNSIGKYNPELERALTLNRRIRILQSLVK